MHTLPCKYHAVFFSLFILVAPCRLYRVSLDNIQTGTILVGHFFCCCCYCYSFTAAAYGTRTFYFILVVYWIFTRTLNHRSVAFWPTTKTQAPRERSLLNSLKTSSLRIYTFCFLNLFSRIHTNREVIIYIVRTKKQRRNEKKKSDYYSNSTLNIWLKWIKMCGITCKYQNFLFFCF